MFLFICFSKGLERTDKMDIGLQLEGSVDVPDLQRGITFACLNARGKQFLLIQRLYKYVSESVIKGAASLSILLSCQDLVSQIVLSVIDICILHVQ